MKWSEIVTLNEAFISTYEIKAKYSSYRKQVDMLVNSEVRLRRVQKFKLD